MDFFLIPDHIISALWYFCVAESVAVMSVDLGSEWMKIAIVKPGVPMEIVLNKYVLEQSETLCTKINRSCQVI